MSSVKPVSIIISLLGWLAVEEIGHKATDVARILGINLGKLTVGRFADGEVNI